MKLNNQRKYKVRRTLFIGAVSIICLFLLGAFVNAVSPKTASLSKETAIEHAKLKMHLFASNAEFFAGPSKSYDGSAKIFIVKVKDELNGESFVEIWEKTGSEGDKEYGFRDTFDNETNHKNKNGLTEYDFYKAVADKLK